MPWVKVEMCNGCGLCVDQCPADAISMEDSKAMIHLEKCIRCGTCHDICPEKAILHDAERIPDDVKSNVEKVKACMEGCAKHFGRSEEAEKCLNRWVKNYNREKIIAEQTIQALQSLQKT